jgi:hypothetical protein
MSDPAPFDAADYLDDEETIAEYIAAAREDPNPDVLLAAVRDAARARAVDDQPRNIHRAIEAYWGDSRGEYHRYLSWEHCYQYFQEQSQTGILRDRDTAALHLGFYLASWGMYRESSFLLQRDYRVHTHVIDVLADSAVRTRVAGSMIFLTSSMTRPSCS